MTREWAKFPLERVTRHTIAAISVDGLDKGYEQASQPHGTQIGTLPHDSDGEKGRRTRYPQPR